MMRYIDANVLSDAVMRSKNNNPHTNRIAKQNHIHEHRHFCTMIEAIPTADVIPTPKWIDTNKQLPKESASAQDRVLVVVHDAFHAGNIIDTDRIYNGRWVRWGDSVTHWMPLPEDMP